MPVTVMNIEDELKIVVAGTPEVKSFIRKFSEYLESGVKIIKDQYSFCSDFDEVRRLSGEQEGYQKTIEFLKTLLIRPEKDNGEES